METTISAIGFKLTPAIEAYTKEKIDKLNKYFTDTTYAKAVLTVSKNSQFAEITIYSGPDIYRGESKASHKDMYDAINEAVNHLSNKIRRFKKQLKKQNRGTIRVEKIEDILDTSDFIISKFKRIQLKPMSVEEAILQMQMTDHNWFVFLDSETNKVSIVYLRKYGDYGLILAD